MCTKFDKILAFKGISLFVEYMLPIALIRQLNHILIVISKMGIFTHMATVLFLVPFETTRCGMAQEGEGGDVLKVKVGAQPMTSEMLVWVR